MRWLKETNKAPTRTERLMSTNAGSPKSREAQGDGVAIVLNCSGECPRHGEGQQVVWEWKGKGREMRRAEPGSYQKLESRIPGNSYVRCAP